MKSTRKLVEICRAISWKSGVRIFYPNPYHKTIVSRFVNNFSRTLTRRHQTESFCKVTFKFSPFIGWKISYLGFINYRIKICFERFNIFELKLPLTISTTLDPTPACAPIARRRGAKSFIFFIFYSLFSISKTKSENRFRFEILRLGKIGLSRPPTQKRPASAPRQTY